MKKFRRIEDFEGCKIGTPRKVKAIEIYISKKSCHMQKILKNHDQNIDISNRPSSQKLVKKYKDKLALMRKYVNQKKIDK